MAEFKIKKSSQQHASVEKTSRKHKKIQIVSTTKKVKNEIIEEDIIILKDNALIKSETKKETHVKESTFKVPDNVNCFLFFKLLYIRLMKRKKVRKRIFEANFHLLSQIFRTHERSMKHEKNAKE